MVGTRSLGRSIPSLLVWWRVPTKGCPCASRDNHWSESFPIILWDTLALPIRVVYIVHVVGAKPIRRGNEDEDEHDDNKLG